MKLQFGDCTLDSEARTLHCRGHEVHLAPKAFELLNVLVRHRPRVLAKAELLEQVWSDVFVSDESLAKLISQIRRAIGETDASPVIRTVHGYGYAFAADAHELHATAPVAGEPTARCWIFCGPREFPLRDGEHIVGREPEASIWLDSPKVSRRHARFVVSGTQVTLEDLGSKNGSYVRGVRIAAPTILESGDEALIGPFKLLFRVAVDSGSTQTEMWPGGGSPA